MQKFCFYKSSENFWCKISFVNLRRNWVDKKWVLSIFKKIDAISNSFWEIPNGFPHDVLTKKVLANILKDGKRQSQKRISLSFSR